MGDFTDFAEKYCSSKRTLGKIPFHENEPGR